MVAPVCGVTQQSAVPAVLTPCWRSTLLRAHDILFPESSVGGLVAISGNKARSQIGSNVQHEADPTPRPRARLAHTAIAGKRSVAW